MENITYDQLEQLGLPPVIHYAIPIMLGLVALEYGVSAWKKRDIYDKKDLVGAVGVGLGNLASSALSKAAMFSVILFFYNLVPWRIEGTWWSYIVCLVCPDFGRYWAHRIAHEQRFWWATHVTHHSSKQYNFSVSFRLSWVQNIKVIFFLPVAMMGFDPVVFFVCHQIEVLYQFWIHTEYIRKLPAPIEFIFTTPSHHRVHHATNEKYRDKNYGSTFIIWDRIFGTFHPEEEQAIYGITKPIKSITNPVYLVFHEWVDIYNELLQATTWRGRFRVVFGHPSGMSSKERKEQREQVEVDQVEQFSEVAT